MVEEQTMEVKEINEKLSFDELNLKDDLLRGIFSYGFENPSKIQYSSIPSIVEGKDIIAQAQSGTGKTGSFVIGSLQKINQKLKASQILIISPTHELVRQTSEVVQEISKYMDISSMEVMGGTNIEECKRKLNKSPQIIIGTPGRVLDMIHRKHLFTDNIHTLIFDEADEILSYGFKETIYNIIQFISSKTQICLFSATMPPEILELSESFMRNPEKILVNKEQLTLEGIIQYYVSLRQSDWKYDVLKDLYDTINISQCIIYINSRNRLMEVYHSLIRDEFPVGCIHGELNSNERKDVMEKFKSGHTRILLSTDLLSRGIDIQQLSLVINYDLPKSKETYIHRIGRSGRYGRKGVAINLITDRELQYMKEIETFYDTQIQELPQNISEILSA
jgi:translation initiation factor 4A